MDGAVFGESFKQCLQAMLAQMRVWMVLFL
jgi:hypothetical protein